MLLTHARRFSFLFLCRLSSTWWGNNKKDHRKTPSFDSAFLCCSNKSIKEQEAWWNSVATRPLESNGCQKRSKETWQGHFHNQMATRWEVQIFHSEPMDGRKNIADTWISPTTIDISHTAPWHQRHRYESTIALGTMSQAGPMKARKDFQTHYENSRKSSTRTRTTEFLYSQERVSQNWRTHFSQLSPSSSSSQTWWQHELQDTQWREHQDTQWRDPGKARSPMDRS